MEHSLNLLQCQKSTVATVVGSIPITLLWCVTRDMNAAKQSQTLAALSVGPGSNAMTILLYTFASNTTLDWHSIPSEVMKHSLWLTNYKVFYIFQVITNSLIYLLQHLIERISIYLSETDYHKFKGKPSIVDLLLRIHNLYYKQD